MEPKRTNIENGFGQNINKSYDILGVSLAAPESVFYTQITGKQGNWNKKTQYLSQEMAFDNGMPYLAQAYVYPNGWLQTSMLLSEKEGIIIKDPPDDGIVQDEAELEKRFNNAEGMVYYFTTGDNTVEYVDVYDDAENPTTVTSTNPILVNAAPAFSIDTDKVDNKNNAGTVQKLTRKAATAQETAKNIAFGGVVNAEGGTNQGGTSEAPVGKVHRGFYLFSDSDSMEALRIPFPQIGNPRVANIQLVYALFDDYHLLSAFEADGSTPKTAVKEPDATVTDVQKVKKIFAEKHLNFSQATDPLIGNDKVTGGVKFGRSVGVHQSIYLTESSVQSAQDVAGAFRAWGEVFINTMEVIVPGTTRPFALLPKAEGWPAEIPLTTDGISTVLHNCEVKIEAVKVGSYSGVRSDIIHITVDGFPQDMPLEKTSIHFLPEIGVVTANSSSSSDRSGFYALSKAGAGKGYNMELSKWTDPENPITAPLGYGGVQRATFDKDKQNDACLIIERTSSKIVIECSHVRKSFGGVRIPRYYRIKFGILVTDQ